MRAARLNLLLTAAAAALAGCHKEQPQEQNIAISNAPAEVETLPADESDTTPSNQLVNGEDNPDVNSSTNSSD